ncbi:hypothetical protein D5S17_31665 [Pseudonocardiaceae bacterium YIM PH 21723]|nr:hypothetical protein D5S17_31665 [Pseudonocardiaceae bacterium YIM PH 21723]
MEDDRFKFYKLIKARESNGNTCSVQVELDERHHHVLTRFWATERYTVAWNADAVEQLITHLTELRDQLELRLERDAS